MAGEQLAVNLFDLDQLDSAIKGKLLAGKVDTRNPLRTDWDRKNIDDEVALIFTCDLLEAALICDIIRNLNRKVNDRPTRLYIKRKEWSRIPSGIILTIKDLNGTRLNPKVFDANHMTPALPPQTSIVEL